MSNTIRGSALAALLLAGSLASADQRGQHSPDAMSVCPCQVGLMPSDHCFDDFVSPLSNPFFFEDPRSLTEARGIYLWNELPNSIGGGDVQVWSGQFRVRISPRWSVIAPRLADLEARPGGDGAPQGFLSAPIGFKCNLLRDPRRQRLMSAGMTYFIPGSETAYSNFGGGDFHLFLSGGARIFSRGHWIMGTGFRLPADDTWGTQLWYWSNQWDYQLPGRLFPLVGLNWFHWMSNAGADLGGSVAALDLINIPATGVAGDDVVTGVVGGRWKPTGHWELGAGYEFPLTARTDILESRVYADLIWRY